MRLLACLFAVATSSAFAQQDRALDDGQRTDLLRDVLVSVQAVDRAVIEAQRMRREGAPIQVLRQVRIHQPYALHASGIVISADGKILTQALHPRADLLVTVTTNDGKSVEATLLGTDPRSNVALLALPEREAPRAHLRLDALPAAAGETVYVSGHVASAGNALAALRGRIGLDRTSVRLRDVYGVSEIGEVHIGGAFAVITEQIAPHAGSVCLSESGKLLGMVIGSMPYFYRARGAIVQIQYALPAPRLRKIVSDLETHGRVIRAWFGLHYQPVKGEVRAHFALPASACAITRVVPDSPAAKAGLRVHDVIVSLDGRDYRDAPEFGQAMADKPPGADVRFGILRAGEPLELTATPVER